MKNSIYFFLYISMFYACQNKQAKQNTDSAIIDFILPPVSISDEKSNASGPSLTKDPQGNPVLSWVQQQDSAETYLLCYAISSDSGQSFGKPKTIPTTKGIYPHDENLSKLVFRPNGDIIAMFAVSNPNPENSYAGLVYYTQSFDGGTTWSASKQLAKDTLNSIDERYFDMTLLPDGEVGAVWLDSRKNSNKEGSSLYFSATRGRNGFGDEKVIDTHTCQCCRTDLYVDNKNKLHIAYRAILNDSIRDMMHMVSTDNGKQFSKPERISADNWVIRGCPHTGPALASNSQGMHVAWYTMGGSSGVFYSQLREKEKFTPRESVSTIYSAKHPQITALSNENVAIVWDEKVDKGGETNNRIGLQLRNNEGEIIHTTHITTDTLTATHPVILSTAKSQVLIAYTQMSEDKKQVKYQLIKQNE
jgi:hypothetical protein